MVFDVDGNRILNTEMRPSGFSHTVTSYTVRNHANEPHQIHKEIIEVIEDCDRVVVNNIRKRHLSMLVSHHTMVDITTERNINEALKPYLEKPSIQERKSKKGAQTVRDILENYGYSKKAIKFYINRVNAGVLGKFQIHYTITGACGDTIEIFLLVESGKIRAASFLAIGCPGIFISGSALTSLITGKTPTQAFDLQVEEIVEYLEGLPEKKVDCAILAKKVLHEALINWQNGAK
jgi:nitrogen fixation NifU-like protein